MALSNDHSIRKHVYEALESSQHIRLIILHQASSADAPLKFTFQQARLSELQGRYEAISYTWGKPNLIYPLHVSDGTHVLVTENLDRALRYLRRSHRDRALWADAACINQANDVEKSTQIPLMVQIFRGARTVLAWLDPGSAVSLRPDVELTMRKIDYVSRTRRHDVLPGSRVETEGDGKEDNAPLSKHSREVLELLNLPWFNRLWIVQEVVFNQEVRLIYGDVELSWARFVVAISVLSALDNRRPNNLNLQGWGSITRIARLWKHHSLLDELLNDDGHTQVNLLKHTDIISLVDEFALYGCTDPRDRVFALYSMASNLRPSTVASGAGYVLMDVDYSLDLRQTYEAFALACIKAGNIVVIMEAVLSRQHSPTPHGWASWVPDWRVPRPAPVSTPELAQLSLFFQFEDFPPGVLGISVFVFGRLLGVRNETYPSILAKAIGRTAFQQMLDFETKLRGLNGVIDSRNLFNMLDYMLDPNCAAMLPLLEQHLCGMTENTASQSGPSLYPRGLDALRLELDRMIGEAKSMFTFEIPGTNRRSVGYGNAKLETGDQLIPLNAPGQVPKKLKMALILRRAGKFDTHRGPKTTYRLIGSGYVYDSCYGYDVTSEDHGSCSYGNANWDYFRGLYLV
jgi:hypothetical protein